MFQYIVISGYIYACLLGAKALIKEESEGTIEFLYAHPISRTKIVSMKILSSFALFYLFIIIMGITSTLMSLVVKPDNLKIMELLMDFKLMFSGFFLVGLVFMSIGFLISALIPHLRLAMPLAIGVFFITYLLGIFSGMIETLSFLKYLSPFHYAVPSEIIKEGIQPTYIALALIIISVSLMTTYLLYKKKDFRI